MRTFTRSGQILLYAAAFFTASQGEIACTTDKTSSQTSQVSDIEGPVFEPCRKYMDLPDSYGYCIYNMSGGFQSRKDIETFCPQAGSWEMECRHAWVAGKMHDKENYTIEELLQDCGENPDCTFELIDFRPADDVLVQLDRCKKYVRKHVRDCFGHAMQRWWFNRPDKEEVARVMERSSVVPDRVAYYVAASVECAKIGTCEGENYLKQLCQKNVLHFQKNPTKCPVYEALKMQGQFSPKEFTPNPNKSGSMNSDPRRSNNKQQNNSYRPPKR